MTTTGVCDILKIYLMVVAFDGFRKNEDKMFIAYSITKEKLKNVYLTAEVTAYFEFDKQVAE